MKFNTNMEMATQRAHVARAGGRERERGRFHMVHIFIYVQVNQAHAHGSRQVQGREHCQRPECSSCSH